VKIKKLHEFDPLMEAQAWPEGSIAKVTSKQNLGKEHYGWSTYTPNQASGAKGGVFYMKITHSGRKWMEGPLLIGNCLTNVDFKKVRADKAVLEQPGPEYKIFMQDGVIEKSMIGQSFFLDGKETGPIDMEGKPVSVSEGEYIVKSYNFDLTVTMKETVCYLQDKGGKKTGFNAPISSLKSYTSELNQNQKEVIAEWFAKELGGAEIEVKSQEFTITQWYVKANQTAGYPNSFSAGPFVNEKQAKDVLDTIVKMNKYSMFDPEKAKVESTWSKTNLNLDGLIDWAKTVGVKTTMKELLALRKGAVIGKDFGI
jgi:hypothetical protein